MGRLQENTSQILVQSAYQHILAREEDPNNDSMNWEPAAPILVNILNDFIYDRENKTGVQTSAEE